MSWRRSPKYLLSLFFAATFMWQQAFADEPKMQPTVVKDAHYGEVLYYFYQQDYFPAIVRLLAAQQQEKMQNHDADAELLLGGLYLSYGHHLRAAEIFEQLLADNVDPAIRDRTWFFLAKIWQQRGYLSEAQTALGNIQGELPEAIETERNMLQAQLFIGRGDYEMAISLLQGWPGRSEWAGYAKFNLGVALVRNGQMDDGADILHALGKMDPYNEELSSLRDKANLALGYAYLQNGQPRAAKAPLQRVRLSGPFSSKALLGVGWADAERDKFRSALAPWMELRGRDLLDPAVQESMLAVPYAMAKLDSISQAADHYLNAVEAFHEENSRIEHTIERIESGRLFDQFLPQDAAADTGWYWKLNDLPQQAETPYLYHLLSTHEFQEGLKNYRDLVYLVRNLEKWQRSIGVYRNMLDTRKLAFDQRLPLAEQSLAAADLDGMVNRKLQFEARLDSIEQAGDSLALASAHEFALWGEIAAIERHPALQGDFAEAKEVRDKVRMLKGVLQWDLDKDFNDRLWKIRRNLRQTGESLVATQRSRRQIDESMHSEPLTFESFSQRVNQLGPRVDNMRQRVEASMGRQRAFLRLIAVDELRAQQQRLETYSVQARFALAAIYDLSATTVGSAAQ